MSEATLETHLTKAVRSPAPGLFHIGQFIKEQATTILGLLIEKANLQLNPSKSVYYDL